MAATRPKRAGSINRCRERDIAVQHILYEPAEVARLGGLIETGVIPGDRLSVIYVLGRYAANQQSDPADLAGFLDAAAHLPAEADWMVCAFGVSETAVLGAALARRRQNAGWL